MSGRMRQVFIAPGQDENAPVLDTYSPWVFGRVVSIPYEYWTTILQAVGNWDSSCSVTVERLAEWQNREQSFADASWSEIENGIRCLERFADHIKAAPPLVTEATDDMPDVFENEEIGRMIASIVAVLRESLREQQRYRVWVD